MTMVEQTSPIEFFLGANTPDGFVGFHRELYDAHDGWRVFLIKSGPGTGKSTLMRKVESSLLERGIETERILCSSDPDSLDGVVAPQRKLALLDATTPHVLEPRYWGAVESVVDLSCAMDSDTLFRNRQAIIAATDACSATHARCRRFLNAAASVLSDNARIATEYTDVDKIIRYADWIAGKEFGDSNGSRNPKRRFLSAVTPHGILTYYNTLSALCPRIYAIEDEYGATAQVFVDRIAKRAAAAGFSPFVCPCPLAPEHLEHVLIAEIGVGFTVSNTWHKADFPVFRRIHAARFTNTDGIKHRKQRLQFNRRIAKELLDEAVELSVLAKAQHDRIEQLYLPAMDWDKVTAVAEQTVHRLETILDNG